MISLDVESFEKRIRNQCKLDGGRIVEYDRCDKDGPEIANDGWRKDWDHLGTGLIYSVNGIKQNSTEVLHFWSKPNRR